MLFLVVNVNFLTLLYISRVNSDPGWFKSRYSSSKFYYCEKSVTCTAVLLSVGYIMVNVNNRSQFSFFIKFQQGLCVSHIVISLTYHLAHVKTEYKWAASPSPFSLNTNPPPPMYYTSALWAGGHGLSSFSRPTFCPSLNSQEAVVFWQQCQWDQNCKGFLLIQKG